jgi:hypothetical protein
MNGFYFDMRLAVAQAVTSVYIEPAVTSSEAQIKSLEISPW